MSEKIELKVKGMTCNHCKMHVTNALKNLSGIDDAEVSLEQNNAKVIYNPDVVTTDDMITAVKDAGYEASL